MIPTISLVFLSLLHAEKVFPKKNWQDKPDPIASPDAEIGGIFRIFAGQYPQSFNYYLDNNSFTAEIFSLMYETLLSRDPLTLADQPAIAKQWIISADQREFTFKLDPQARWSDGKPITATDVQWTFKTILNPKNLTGIHKVSLEKFEDPVVLGPYTIRFRTKEVHWRNLMAIGGLMILPKHVYDNQDFNTINVDFPVVSGLYILKKLKEGVSVDLERRSDWWQKDKKSTQGVGNFQTLRFKFFASRPTAFETFKKGLIDLYPVYTSRIWINETKGNKFAKNWIVKQKIYNDKPVGFQGYVMNMRRSPFDNLHTRLAMAHLLDRERMNKSLMYQQYFLHRSYYEDLYSSEHPCPNTLIPFDKEKARKLLQKAGWVINPKTGILEQEGKPFQVKFLTRDPSSEKFLAIYAEDLKDVGILLDIEQKDWAAWSKDMDQFNFSMTWAAWGSGVFKDPEGMWHSKEAERKAGNNISGFKDKKVDQLIEKQKTIFNVEQRHKLARQVDQRIYQQHPYALLWNIDYTRLLYWNKFGTPDTILSKYGDERSAYLYWWYDEGLAEDLENVMKRKQPLPRKEEKIIFDQAFSP